MTELEELEAFFTSGLSAEEIAADDDALACKEIPKFEQELREWRARGRYCGRGADVENARGAQTAVEHILTSIAVLKTMLAAPAAAAPWKHRLAKNPNPD